MTWYEVRGAKVTDLLATARLGGKGTSDGASDGDDTVSGSALKRRPTGKATEGMSSASRSSTWPLRRRRRVMGKCSSFPKGKVAGAVATGGGQSSAQSIARRSNSSTARGSSKELAHKQTPSGEARMPVMGATHAAITESVVLLLTSRCVASRFPPWRQAFRRHSVRCATRRARRHMAHVTSVPDP